MIIQGEKRKIFYCSRKREILIGLYLLYSTVAVCGKDYFFEAVNAFGQRGLFNTYSAKTLGIGCLSINIYGNLCQNNDFVLSVKDSNSPSKWPDSLMNPTALISSVYYNIGYGLSRYLDLSITLPFYIDYVSSFNPIPSNKFGGDIKKGVGDFEISLKWQYPPYPHKKVFEIAYFGGLSLPTGDRKKDSYFPRQIYYFIKDSTSEVVGFFTSEHIEVDMKMVWTLDFNEIWQDVPVEFHLNYGIRWTRSLLDHLVLLNTGISYRPYPWLALFTELTSENRLSNIDLGYKRGNDPLRLSPGIFLSTKNGIFFSAGVDINMSSKGKLKYYVLDKDREKKMITTQIEPRIRLAANIGWTGLILNLDKDRDGIEDNTDQCPKEAEDFDGFQDTNGCPEWDNDNDNFIDSLDKCPDEKEDFDGYQDTDGCPEFDIDGDGILDVDDNCPLVNEDVDGFEDNDGCLDDDNDGDGIYDTLDQCINLSEDKDGYEDSDGCPEWDNDMDAISDTLDNCPNEAESYNGFEDDDGCPDEKLVKIPKPKEINRGRVILRGIYFEFGKAVLTGGSYSILDQLYQSLVEWPEIKLEIRGHTDSMGKAWINKHLSYVRAKNICDYLVRKGIANDRLIPIGMGESEPIADNKTVDGRTLNRRVELHRID